MLALYEKLVGTWRLCEYLSATVSSELNVHNVHEHAAVLHLRLLRPQTMLRGDRTCAAAVQVMLFYTRKSLGTLAAALSRWSTCVQLRKAQTFRAAMARGLRAHCLLRAPPVSRAVPLLQQLQARVAERKRQQLQQPTSLRPASLAPLTAGSGRKPARLAALMRIEAQRGLRKSIRQLDARDSDLSLEERAASRLYGEDLCRRALQALQAWGMCEQSHQHARLQQLFGSWRGLTSCNRAAEQVERAREQGRLSQAFHQWQLLSLRTAASRNVPAQVAEPPSFGQKWACARGLDSPGSPGNRIMSPQQQKLVADHAESVACYGIRPAVSLSTRITAASSVTSGISATQACMLQSPGFFTEAAAVSSPCVRKAADNAPADAWGVNRGPWATGLEAGHALEAQQPRGCPARVTVDDLLGSPGAPTTHIAPMVCTALGSGSGSGSTAAGALSSPITLLKEPLAEGAPPDGRHPAMAPAARCCHGDGLLREGPGGPLQQGRMGVGPWDAESLVCRAAEQLTPAPLEAGCMGGSRVRSLTASFEAATSASIQCMSGGQRSQSFTRGRSQPRRPPFDFTMLQRFSSFSGQPCTGESAGSNDMVIWRQ
ncbi:hypothetical protein WJX75_008134 [Coccomyxa subellipsoidea]|uniref:DUF4005 domain-containing protein n=1 Tax=Coccomyxa subellipsoidea TaxID=248742 RepID=A0ABR2YNS3_9CHLO